MRKYNNTKIIDFLARVDSDNVESIPDANSVGSEVLNAALILAIQKEALTQETVLKDNITKVIVALIKALPHKKWLYTEYPPGISPFILATKYQHTNLKVYRIIKKYIPSEYLKDKEMDTNSSAQQLNRILSYQELIPKEVLCEESKFGDMDEKMTEADHKSSPSSLTTAQTPLIQLISDINLIAVKHFETVNAPLDVLKQRCQIINSIDSVELINLDKEIQQKAETSLIYIASFGLAEAQNKLGEYYFELAKKKYDPRGKTDIFDSLRDKAVTLFQFAASQKLPLALYNLGRDAQVFGGLVKRDLVLKYNQLAAAQSLPQAQAALGYYYQARESIENNFQLAAHYYELAKAQGYPLNLEALKFLKNFQEIRDLQQPASVPGPSILDVLMSKDEQFPDGDYQYTRLKKYKINVPENPDDQYELALNYIDGKGGCEKNLDFALDLFFLAGARGKVEALIKLGWDYYTSSYFNKETAVLLFQMAASRKGESVPLKRDEKQKAVFKSMYVKYTSKDGQYSTVTDTHLHTPVNQLRTQAIEHFTGTKNNSKDLRSFGESYTTEAIESLVFSEPQSSNWYNAVFTAPPDDKQEGISFLTQFRALWILKNLFKLQTGGLRFICYDPAGFNTSHFNFIMVWNGALFVIDPLAKEITPDKAQQLSALKNQYKLHSIIISTTQIQDNQEETKGIVSCGPICVELMRYFQQLTPKNLKQKLKENLPIKQKKSFDNELTHFEYSAIDLVKTDLLPASLKSLAEEKNTSGYQTKMTQLRESHLKILEKSNPQKNYKDEQVLWAWLSREIMKDDRGVNKDTLVLDIEMYQGFLNSEEFTSLKASFFQLSQSQTSVSTSESSFTLMPRKESTASSKTTDREESELHY